MNTPSALAAMIQTSASKQVPRHQVVFLDSSHAVVHPLTMITLRHHRDPLGELAAVIDYIVEGATRDLDSVLERITGIPAGQPTITERHRILDDLITDVQHRIEHLKIQTHAPGDDAALAASGMLPIGGAV